MGVLCMICGPVMDEPQLPCRAFLLVFLVKLICEGAGRWSDNFYLTGSPLGAAVLSASVVALGFPVARQAVVKDDRKSQAAICVAVFFTTWSAGAQLAVMWK